MDGDFQTMCTITSSSQATTPIYSATPSRIRPRAASIGAERGGSNTLTGWFAIDNVTYVNGAVTAIDLRFELHSEGGTPALHGAIHWTAGG